MTFLEERDTPKYPDLGATVAKFRRKAMQAGSIREMLEQDRRAYADAIEKAIRAKQRVMHMRPTPPTTPAWYKPPSITRLLHYENPPPMKGDPPNARVRDWAERAEVLYAHMMEEKARRTECLQAAE